MSKEPVKHEEKTATRTGKSVGQIDKYRSELAFEKQCNAELGRRSRAYLRLVERYEFHREFVDGKLDSMTATLQSILSTCEGTNISSEIETKVCFLCCGALLIIV